MKTTPYGHQADELERHWQTPVRAIFWEQGTGKSKLIIDTACKQYSAGLIDTVVILAPNGVHRNWVSDEIPAHLWDDIHYRAIFWRGGRTVREQRALSALLTFNGLRILTVNYQAIYDRKSALSTRKLASKAKAVLKDFLTSKTLLVFDESTAIKTASSKTSRTAWGLSAACKYKRILSGQPVTQHPLDLYAQFRVLNIDILKHKTYTLFKSRYAVVFKMDNYEIIKAYKNLGEMKDNYAPHSTRVLKKDCLDLPEKLPPISRYFELSTNQGKHYTALADRFLTELNTPCVRCDGRRVFNNVRCSQCSGTGTIIDARLALVRRLRFQQITCGFIKDEAGETHTLCDSGQNPRIQLLRQCLSENEAPTIIWAWQHFDLTAIGELLKKMKISFVEYSGRVSDDDKAAAKVKFQEEKSVRVFLASQASCYSGHTLHRAEVNIYYSQTDNGEHRWQSEDRSHRAGLKHPVSYIDFYSDRPIESAVMNNLRRKKQYNDLMMRGVTVPLELTKEEMQSWI